MDASEEQPQHDPVIESAITIFNYIYRLFYPIFFIISIPIHIFTWFYVNLPILTYLSLFLFITTLLIAMYSFRRLSSAPRDNFINYILYTIIPYSVSIVYTAVSFFFPQIRMFTRIGSALLHPINFIVGLISKVDERAQPVRRTVEALIAEKKGGRKSAEEVLNDSRLQCCVCQLNEKTVLLRPCNHVCLCDRCNSAIQRQNEPTCPICRTKVDGFEMIYLS